jgi:hypothetical protein
MTATWRALLADWLRTHNGVIDRATLLRLGVSRRTVTEMVRRGDLRRIFPGVYHSASVALGPLQIMTAICLRNPAAIIAFVTAGGLHGIRGMRKRIIHVLVPHGHSPVLRGVVVHRCRDVAESDIVVRPDGIRLTSVARTLFDSSWLLGEQDASSALEQCLDKKWVTLEEMIEITERLAKRRRPGSRQMRRILLSRPAWRAAVQSDLEHRVVTALRKAGLPDPVTQLWITLPSGVEVRLDVAWPSGLLALEIDHPFWHDYTGAVRRDKHRDRKAATLGWQTLRVEEADIDNDLVDVIEDVRQVLGLRAA